MEHFPRKSKLEYIHKPINYYNMEPRTTMIIKLAVAGLLLLCLLNMPYGFYQLVRFVAMISFAYFSYDYFKDKQDGLGYMFAALAILFQPFLKITLGRTIWNIIDVVVAIGLICLAIMTFKKKGK